MGNLGRLEDYDEDCSVLEKDKKEGEKPFIRLDLACGNAKKEGFIGADIAEGTQANLITNLECYPWAIKTYRPDGLETSEELDAKLVMLKTMCRETNTLPDNCVSEVHCSHYIEHVTDLISFMNELYRVMAPGATATFYAPYYSSVRCWQDPTHKHAISENTFIYYNRAWREGNKLTHYPIRTDFAILSTKFLYNPLWRMRSDDAKEYARQHSINVVDDIEVVLKKLPMIK